MKITILSLVLVLLMFSCKKSSDLTENPQSQIQQLIAKYPNLKLVSIKKDENQPDAVSYASPASLAEFDKELAKLSAMGKSIKVVLSSVSTSRNLKTQSVQSTLDNVYGSYAWTGSQQAGSSEVGYYTISYFASFGYYTDFTYPPGVNYIQSISSLSSFAQPLTFSVGAFPGYHEYNYSYVAASTRSSIVTQNQVGSLAFSGTVSLTKTYHYLTLSTVVASVSGPLAYNPQVYASSFPKLIP